MEKPFERDPSALAYGAVVGAWRVVGWGGQGSYGVVYSVQRVDDAEGGLFALKMALDPGDERLAREAELLACMEPPHAPRLHDSGWWTPVEGVSFPFLVMDWVAGAHLYEWAEQHKISYRQVMRMMGQLLRALEALHAMEGVHRDVKGANVLVTEEGRAVLTDFGMGAYRGASVLTRQAEPVGTPRYLSPQALLHREKYWGRSEPRYEASAADDMYAAGVTAWCLVTGSYPPFRSDSEQGEGGVLGAYGGRVLREDLEGVPPECAAPILRMLADDPAARGHAGEVAQALEEAAEKAGREADCPIPRSATNEARVSPARPVRARGGTRWGLGWVGAAVALMVALNVWRFLHRQPAEEPEVVEQEAKFEEEPDAGAAGAAEAVLAGQVDEGLPVVEKQGVYLDLPKKPLPGQRRPPCGKYEVAINDGCWVRPGVATPPCGSVLYEWNNGCYSPTFTPSRSPTSE